MHIIENFDPIKHVDPVQSLIHGMGLPGIEHHVTGILVVQAASIDYKGLRYWNPLVFLRVKNEDRCLDILHVPDWAAMPSLEGVKSMFHGAPPANSSSAAGTSDDIVSMSQSTTPPPHTAARK